MRILLAAGLACAACALVQCTPRQFNSGSEVKDAHSGDGVTRVNPKAFNAYNIWRDGKGVEILDYPLEYNVRKGGVAPDDVFYVAKETYIKQPPPFSHYGDYSIASTTKGAKVEGDILTYPTKEGRALALKFYDFRNEGAKNQLEAAQYCKSVGLRLPQVQEILDFCAAGTSKYLTVDYHWCSEDEAPCNTWGEYRKHRCGGESQIPSASVSSSDREIYWQFYRGGISGGERGAFGGDLKCVGPVPAPVPATDPNKLPFNAFEMWRTGEGAAVLDYPPDYNSRFGGSKPDGLFYEWSWRENGKFIGVPTAGAEVMSDIIVYPALGGRTLKLKFSQLSLLGANHSQAVQHCREKGLRLPTTRELFDFCATRTPAAADGSYPKNRCGQTKLWTAVVWSGNHGAAWLFDGTKGLLIETEDRLTHGLNGVRCVSGG